MTNTSVPQTQQKSTPQTPVTNEFTAAQLTMTSELEELSKLAQQFALQSEKVVKLLHQEAEPAIAPLGGEDIKARFDTLILLYRGFREQRDALYHVSTAINHDMCDTERSRSDVNRKLQAVYDVFGFEMPVDCVRDFSNLIKDEDIPF